MSKKTIEQVREELNAKIPREAVTTRDSGFGAKLSYLTGHYVIDRLNKVFGPENWAKTIELTKTFEGEVNGKQYVSYYAQVTLSVTFPDDVFKRTQDAGFGDGTDKNLGKAHELAIKEAITDGLKRCAKDLGMSMGLALYDKTQENVEDEAHTPDQKAVNKDNTTTSGANTGGGKAGNRPTNSAVTRADSGNSSAGGTKPAIGSAQATTAYRASIKSALTVLQAQKNTTLDQFRKDMGISGKLDELDDTNINLIYSKLKDKYPELKLGA